MRTVSRSIVAAVICSADGLILFGRKPKNSGAVYPDCWHIPGGGVEKGEGLEEALAREIASETGLDLTMGTLRLIDTKGRGESLKTVDGEEVLCKMEFTVYQIDLPKRSRELSLSANDDLAELQWRRREELTQIKLTPPARELFARLGWIPKD